MSYNEDKKFIHFLVFPPLVSNFEPSLFIKRIGNIKVKIITYNDPLMVVIKPHENPDKPVYVLLVGIDFVFGKEHFSTIISPILLGPLYDEYYLIKDVLTMNKPFYYNFVSSKNKAYYVTRKHIKLMRNKIDVCSNVLCRIIYNCSSYFITCGKYEAYLRELPNIDKPVKIKYRLIKSVSDEWFKIDLFFSKEKIRKKLYVEKRLSKQECYSMAAETSLYIYFVNLMHSKLSLQYFQNVYLLLGNLYSNSKLLEIIGKCIDKKDTEACLVSAIYEAIKHINKSLRVTHSTVLMLKELIKANKNLIYHIISTCVFT